MSYSIGLKLKVFATISKQNSSFRVDDVTGWRVRLHEELCSGRFPWERLSWVLPTTWPWTYGTRRSCPWPEKTNKKQINDQVETKINSEGIWIPEVDFIDWLLALRLTIRGPNTGSNSGGGRIQKKLIQYLYRDCILKHNTSSFLETAFSIQSLVYSWGFLPVSM